MLALGSSKDGRLGTAGDIMAGGFKPRIIEGLRGVRIVQISCGWGHSVAVSGMLEEC